ncbi:MAG: MHYT domain-containing protein, partial [Xanthobacteraceae bacterium]
MQVTHEPWLVALSLIVAIQGAYVGLSLAVQVGGSTGLRRRLLLAGAAFSLAVAIWSMHFVGMLATRLPFPVDYLVFPTLLSFLVCVLVVGAAVFTVSAGPPTRGRLVAAAAAMGGGIVSMHYIGMSALHASAHLQHAVPFVVASAVIAVAASGLALWLAGGRGGRPPLLLSASALGAAISGMHNTAGAGFLWTSRGGVGGPPRRFARHLPAARPAAPSLATAGSALITGLRREAAPAGRGPTASIAKAFRFFLFGSRIRTIAACRWDR